LTLIELLVSVSILSLLMAILAGTYDGARGQSARVICLAQLRTVTLGATAYAHDNADWLPLAAQAYDGKDHFDLSPNIVRMTAVGYDLPALLGSYVGPQGLSCRAPDPRPVNDRANAAPILYSNYIFLWGAAPSTPVEGVRRLTEGFEESLAVADFTWYNVDAVAGETLRYGGNHGRAGARIGAIPEADLITNPTAAQFIQDGKPVDIVGMNAARLSGSADWYPRKRGRWRVAGPYNQRTAPYSVVYLPGR
jgi:hypothetical protein